MPLPPSGRPRLILANTSGNIQNATVTTRPALLAVFNEDIRKGARIPTVNIANANICKKNNV